MIFNNKAKSQKGITLIALVVTIVVMLILAAVVINMVRGDEGVITQAKMGNLENRGATVEELRDLWKSAMISEENGVKGDDVQSLEELIADMVSKGLLTQNESDFILGNGEYDKEHGYINIGSRTIIFKQVAGITPGAETPLPEVDNPIVTSTAIASTTSTPTQTAVPTPTPKLTPTPTPYI